MLDCAWVVTGERRKEKGRKRVCVSANGKGERMSVIGLGFKIQN